METTVPAGVMDNVYVCLGIPVYDGSAESSTMIRGTAQASQKIRFMPRCEGMSSLCQVYNRLWVCGLGAMPEHKFTHFAMLHSDVVPDAWWIDTLYAEMQATGATVISAVCPIKDTKGVTSTAVGNPADDWDYRRITTTELKRLPQTFTIDDVVTSGIWPESYTNDKCLLVNTGCMLVDMSWSHWYDKLDDGITMAFRFNQDYRIQRWPDGKWNPEFVPEDWQMSRYVHNNGGKVVATKKVSTVHMGKQAYSSAAAWGSATDVEMDAFNAERAKAFANVEVTA